MHLRTLSIVKASFQKSQWKTNWCKVCTNENEVLHLLLSLTGIRTQIGRFSAPMLTPSTWPTNWVESIEHLTNMAFWPNDKLSSRSDSESINWNVLCPYLEESLSLVEKNNLSQRGCLFVSEIPFSVFQIYLLRSSFQLETWAWGYTGPARLFGIG